MSPTISSLPFFVYPVSDMARARAFYGGVLGLKEGNCWEDKWVEYDVGETSLALSTMMEGCQPGAPGGAVALETAGFDEFVAHLKAQGVKFLLEPVDTGVCKFARFADPDGNHLVLHCRHAVPA
jgi:catechol 2,3-dioxygenase-like lactoylglutathione lyase family enzyme